MDAEIQENLKEISSQVQGVGRGIGSPKVNAEKLGDLRQALISHATSLKVYADLLKKDEHP